MQARATFDIVSLLNRLAPAITMVALLALWEIGCDVFRVPEFLLPAPSAIIKAGFNAPLKYWLLNVSATLIVAVCGYLLAIAIGIPLAVMLALSPLLSRTIFPILVVIHSTPVVAVAPIIVVALGVDFSPRIFITFLISFFPIVISTATGVHNTPEELLEMSRSLKAPRFREVLQIRLPSAIPYIFSALKVSITLAVIGAVVAEFVASGEGLGYAILFATSTFMVSTAFANLVVLVALSLILFRIVSGVQSVFFGWSLNAPKDS